MPEGTLPHDEPRPSAEGEGGLPPASEAVGSDGVDPEASPSDLSPTAPQPEAGEDSFPIVGIGASAGGLGAFQQFFEGLPPEPNMAFVLVQHLSPDHESALAEIIQTTTRLSVNQVSDHPNVEPNCVYVIPPGKHLELRDGHLQLVELKRERGKPTAVDHFFRSLAREVGHRAVAVVLSGTGSDGSLGLKAVKERAGLTLAQDPADAEYDGMPKSAIATGLVDLIGTPGQLATRLVEVRRSADTVRMPRPDEDAPATDEQALRSIFAHLRQRTGHDFTHYKRSTILRRLARRLQVAGVGSLSEYAAHLRAQPDEPAALLRDFLISVTQFFRDPEAFDALEAEVIAPMMETAHEQIRVWVPGCATGEEAYTLGMLLCEHADRAEHVRPDIQIFATDIDEAALAHARDGLYPDVVAADLSDDRLRRFFQKEGGGYRVKPELREMVLFAAHNLVADPPFSRLDLVSCRNVLIYFNRAIQERAFASFHYALRPDGSLFLGSSESPDSVSNGFVEVDKGERIYRRRDIQQGTTDFPFPSVRLARPVGAPEADAPEAAAPLAEGLLERYREWTLDQYAPPRLLVDERYDVTHVFGQAGDYLRDREGPVTQNVVDKVLQAFRIDLRTALYRAFSSGESVDTPFRRIETASGTRVVRLHVGPVGGAAAQDGLAEVVFVELDPTSVASLGAPVPDGEGADGDPALHRLEEELRETRSRLRATIEEQETSNEELKASNEELQSINEELQSATEELETSKEELQSMNEELTTVNHELKSKVEELSRSNSDLQNLMGAMEVATLFLDGRLALKRYTPRATDLFNIIPADVGRPFHHLSHSLDRADLAVIARNVQDSLVPVEETLTSEDGESYLLRATPYRTVDDRIDGVVLTFVDITEVEAAKRDAGLRAEQQAVVARLGERALAGVPAADLFDQAVVEVRKVLDADACKVLQHEPDEGRFRMVAGTGWTDGLVGEATVPDAADSQAGYTLSAHETVFVGDFHAETRFSAPDLIADHDLRSGMSTAIQGGEYGAAYGVIGVHCHGCRTFSEADGRFLQSVANVLANAVEAEQQRATIQEQLAEIEAVYETAPVGLAFMDQDLRYRRVNRRLAEINGREARDHIGRFTRDIVPVLAEAIEPLLHRILESGEPLEDVEIRGPSPVDPDDLRAWLCSYVPRLGEGGAIEGINLVVRDITDQKRSEESLAETADRLDLALDGGGLGAFSIDFATDLVSYDGRAQALLGVPPTLRLGEALGNVHPDDHDALVAALEASRDGRGDDPTFTTVHRHVAGDRPPRWVAVRGRSAFEGQGDARRATRLFGVVLDVTALRDAQEAVQSQLAEVESYFDAVPVGIAVINTEGRYVRVNARLAEIAGRSADDLVGQAPRELWPDHALANEPYLERVLETGVPVLNAEMRLPLPRDPDGDVYDWLVSFYPLLQDGDVAGVSVVVQDVTAIRKAQAGLERLTAELEDRVEARTAQVRELAATLTEAEQRERKRVAQVLHDDLQQILYSLQVKLHLLQRAAAGDDAVGVSREALAEQADLLLDKAILSTRTLTVDLSPPVLSGEGLDRTLEWLAHRMGEAYGLDVSVETDGDIEVEGAAHVLLFQVVRELLFNVVKHAGTLEARIAVVQEPGEVIVTVTDEGSGFDASAEVPATSGLGLFSVRERIGLLGGSVEVSSEVGGGTTVTIRCPDGTRS